jgi:hypothetical protein
MSTPLPSDICVSVGGFTKSPPHTQKPPQKQKAAREIMAASSKPTGYANDRRFRAETTTF